MPPIKTLTILIEEYKRIVRENEYFSNTRARDYDIVRRYTSSKKDHGPQNRLCHNVRKNWPISLGKQNNYPNKYGEYVLQSKAGEIGNSTRRLGSIHMPDYISKFGDQCEEKVAETLLSFEMEKVNKFFNTSFGEIEFKINSIIRKPVKTPATIEGANQGYINETILMYMNTTLLNIKTESKVNPLVVKALKHSLKDIQEFRTTPGVIHLARSLITEKTHWLPVTGAVNPQYGEFSHVITSRYHSIPVKSEPNSIETSLERLCYELVKIAIQSLEPKDTLTEFAKSVFLNDQSLDLIIEGVKNDKPATNLLKAVLGQPINIQSKVRSTTFIITEQDFARKETFAIWKFGVLDIKRRFSRFYGHAKIYFERFDVKGYIIVKDQELLRLYIDCKEDGYDAQQLLLDIGYYCACVEPGFNRSYEIYVDEKNVDNKYFEYHSSSYTKMYNFITHFKSNKENGKIIANSMVSLSNSELFLEKIYKLEEPIQPYDQTKQEYFISDSLKLYSEKIQGRELAINPHLLKLPNSPLPVGLKTKHPRLVGLLNNDLKRVETITTAVLTEESFFEDYLTLALDEERESELKSVIATSFLPTESQQAAKRRLNQIIDDEDRFTNPAKRYKAFYYSTVAMTPRPNNNDRRNEEVSSTITLKKNREILDLKRKRGIIVGGEEDLVVFGKRIKLKHTEGEYLLIGIYKEDQKLITYETVDEGKNSNVDRFQVINLNSYYVYSKKVSLWSASDNINKSLQENRKYMSGLPDQILRTREIV